MGGPQRHARHQRRSDPDALGPGPALNAPHPLKYAVVERERRFLVGRLPTVEPHEVWEIHDRYLTGTRLRLREVRRPDGAVVRKLGHKVRLGAGPEAVACTSVYLDDVEWQLLGTLPGHDLHKQRRRYPIQDGWLNIDVLDDGTLIAEVDDGDRDPLMLPDWLDVVREVTQDESWTGVRVATER